MTAAGIGTETVAAGAQPEWLPALAAYLEQHGLMRARGLRVQPLSGGQSNPTYLLEDGAVQRVLRKQPPGKLLPSAHAVDREYRVIDALAGSAVPVPAVFHYCTDNSVVGTPFYLMAYAAGRVFMDPALPGLQPAERAALYGETSRVLAALHQVDYAAAGLKDYGKTGDYFGRQVARWSRQYRDTQTENIPAMEILMDWLPRNLPPGDETCLVHGDFRIDNLVFQADGTQAIALLDWELSTLGHPLADLAYYCMCWRIPPSLWRGIAGLNLHALGIPSEEEVVAAYCAARGIAPPSDWNAYLAYSFFRIAAILQGIHARAQAGNAAGADAADMGARVAPLALLGLQSAQRLDASLIHAQTQGPAHG
jgi:aminoglycoside phosphotransferase (APT) family kinase protein